MSKQQLEEAVARVKAADLSDNITLLFCDYRHCSHLGPFDKVHNFTILLTSDFKQGSHLQ